ncbi:MAG: LamG domain-containing protein [Planctomycetia bacterium]|nr:LamG domain-containing protein [Planctomycetia bacterium]
MYWSFDNDNLGQDDSGHGYHLTISGDAKNSQSTETPTGTGMSYSPANNQVDAIATLDSSSLSTYSVYSVSYWIKASDQANYYNVIGLNGDWNTFWSHSFTDGNVYIGQDGTTRAAIAGLYDTNKWTHVTYTYDKGSASIYKNGELAGSYTDAQWESRSTWNSFHLGNAGSSDNIYGHVDDVAVWTTALSANATKVLAGKKATPTQVAAMTTPTVNAVANDVISLQSNQDAYAYAVLQDNPMAYWRMNETEGDRFVDATGYGSHMTIQNGVTLGGGKTLLANPCPQFSPQGIAAGISFASAIPEGVVMRDGFTVEFWLNPDTFATNHEWTSGTNGSGTTSEDGWANGFCMHTFGNVGKFYVGQNGESRIIPADYSESMILEEWNHLAYTYDGEIGSLYLNGDLVVSQTLVQGGNWSEIWLKNISGMMSDLAIYGYALSAAQIADHYAKGSSELPEPATWSMLLLGLGGILFLRKKRRVT